MVHEHLLADADERRIRQAVAVRLLDRTGDPRHGRRDPLTEREAANLRAAVARLAMHRPDLIEAEHATALVRFYETSGRLAEGQDVLARIGAAGLAAGWIRAGQLAAVRGDLRAAAELAERGLDGLAPTDHDGRVTALLLLAQTAVEGGDAVTARRRLHTALARARYARDPALLGRVFNNLAVASVERGRARDADRQLRAAFEAKRRAGAGPVELGRTLYNRAEIPLALGDWRRAVAHVDQCLPLLLSGAFERLAATALTTKALALLHDGRPAAAATTAVESMRLLNDGGDDHDDRRTAAVVWLRISVVQHAAGELDQARDNICRALPVAISHGSRDRDEAADVLHWHAALLAHRDPATATALIGAGHRLRRRPTPGPVERLTDRTAATARATLGPPEYDRHRHRGTTIDADQLVLLCHAISPRDSQGPRTQTPSARTPLRGP